jgi:hypothetical protein
MPQCHVKRAAHGPTANRQTQRPKRVIYSRQVRMEYKPKRITPAHFELPKRITPAHFELHCVRQSLQAKNA